MSPTRQEELSLLFFFGGGQKRDAFYQSKADAAPPHAPTVRSPRNRKGGPGPELVGLGYRAVSAVGGLQRTCSYGSKKGMINSLLGTFTPLYSKYAFLGALRSAAQMVSYEVSIGLILIVRLVSAFGSAKAIARMFP